MVASMPSAALLSAVVIDVGSAHTRAGYAGEETPRMVCHSASGMYIDANGQARVTCELDSLSRECEAQVVVRHRDLDPRMAV
eukprot:6206778-Pleurochrysis_carterae.AAC.1